jgi:DNA-binding transcriptional LysR family regulator
MQRLARIVARPLVVKSGCGIVATAEARALEPRARELLAAMADFARPVAADVAATAFDLTIAANDLQRDLLLPALHRRLASGTAGVRLRVLPSDLPSVELLRSRGCDLIITPRPPDGSDVVQRRLFRDHYVCFYDAAIRSPPRNRAEYVASRHATVVYPDGGRLQFDQDLERAGIVRAFDVMAPSFAGVSAFLAGSDLIATVPRSLAAHVMRGFAAAPLPLEPAIGRKLAALPMYLVWHRRAHGDAAHRHVRNLLIEIGREAGRAMAGDGP